VLKGGDYMAIKKYEAWKKVVWRFVRIFFAAFISQLSLNALFLGEPEIQKSALVSAVAAGLAALTKAIRELSDDYGAPIHRLPL